MENTIYHVNIGKRATSVNCSQTILLLFITFDSQLLYKIGLLIAFSLSMLGKCFRATISMFSSVQRLSSSSTSLEKEKKYHDYKSSVVEGLSHFMWQCYQHSASTLQLLFTRVLS